MSGMDLERTLRRTGTSLRVHPIGMGGIAAPRSLQAMRLLLAVEDNRLLRRLTAALYHARWVTGEDISSLEVLQRILDSCCHEGVRVRRQVAVASSAAG